MKQYCGPVVVSINIIFYLLLNSNLVLGSGTCSSDAGPSCKACSDSQNNFNDLAGVPRFNAKLQLISNNLGSYTWFNCDATGSCSFFSPGSFTSFLFGSTTSSSDPANYVQNLTVYVGFGLVAAFLTVIVGLSLLFFRYCLNCCINGGTCGKIFPTQRNFCFSCCCGLQLNKQNNKLEYSMGEKWCARITLIIYVILVIAFVGVGWWNATVGVVDSVSNGIQAPNTLASLVQSTSTPTATFLINVLSDTLTTLTNDLTTVLSAQAQPSLLASNLNQIILAATSLPSVASLNSFLNSANSSLTSVNKDLSLLYGALNGVDNEISYLTQTVSNLTAITNGLQPRLNAVTNDIKLTQNNITNSDNFISILTNPTDGTSSILNDFTKLANLPDPTAVVSGLTLVLNDATVTPADLSTTTTTTIPGLANLNSAYSNLPNFTLTAQACSLTNSRIDNAINSNFVGSIIAQLYADQNDVNSLISTLNFVNATFKSVSTNIAGYTLQPIVNAILAINVTLNTLPDFNQLQKQLAIITGITYVVDILANITGLIQNINNTIYQVPAALDTIASLAGKINTTLADNIAKINALQSQITTFQGQIANVTVNGYIDQVNNMTALLQSSYAQLLSGPYVQTLTNVLSQTIVIDFATPINSLISLNSTMANNKIPTSTISLLNTVQSNKVTALGLLQTVQNDFNLWTGTDNGIGAAGTRRCKISGVACGPNSNAACTTAGDYCLVNPNTVTPLAAALTQIHTTATSASTQSTLQSMQKIAAQNPSANTNKLNNGLNQALNSINGVSVTDLSNTLNSLSSSAKSVNTNSIRGNLNSAANSINKVDFTTPQNALSQYQSQVIDQINQNLGNLNDALTLAQQANTLIYVNQPKYQASLQKNNLLMINQQAGLTGLALQAASIIDDVATTLNSTLVNFHPQAVSKVNQYTPALQALQSQSNLNKGSLFYLLTLLQTVGNVTSSNSFQTGLIDSPGGRYDVDANGNTYYNNDKCVTNECITNTFKYYYTKPISSNSNIPIGVSPQTINSYPYLIPLFIALFSLIAMFMLSSHFAASCIASTALGFIFIITPFIFLYMAFGFPLVLTLNDFCYGGSNVGHEYVLGRRDLICSDFGGKGSATECIFNISSTSYVSVNVPVTFDALSTGSCGSYDPFRQLWLSASNSWTTIPTTQVNNLLSQQPNIKPQISSLLTSAASSSSTYISSYITNLQSTLSCSAVASSFFAFKDTTCCQAGKAIYLSIASWYLIAFTMMFCGFPALLLGRKRFAKDIWGPEIVKPQFEGVNEMAPMTLPPGSMGEPYAMSSPMGEEQVPSYMAAVNQNHDQMNFVQNDLAMIQNQPVAPNDPFISNPPVSVPPLSHPANDSMQIEYRGSEPVHTDDVPVLMPDHTPDMI